MKKLPTILLVLAILLALMEFIPGLKDTIYAIHRPLSAVFFGLFLVTHVMSKETDRYDAEHDSASHDSKEKH